MVTDSITNASIPMAASKARDLVKKKRANRSAKLKQVKRDVRREQWLSQVKKKESKKDSKGDSNCGGACNNTQSVHARNESDRLTKNLEIDSGIEENDESIHQLSEPESNSPTSPISSVLGGTESRANFSSSSCRSSSGESNFGEEEEKGDNDDDHNDDDDDDNGDDDDHDDDHNDDDDDDNDNWETLADSLEATDDDKKKQPTIELPSSLASGTGIQKPQPGSSRMALRKAPPRAWRSDDASRPQNLPNLSKQHSFPLNSERKSGRGCALWGCKSISSAPTSCPICYEDLDLTDSSFLPCSCGFRICLFCHKRILEEDGRCPGCRKQYDHGPRKGDGRSVTFQLGRSYSMHTRS